MGVDPGPGPPTQAKPRWRRAAEWLVSVAIIGAIFGFAVPQFASYGDAWDQIRTLDSGEILGLAAVVGWNLTTYWFVLTAALPRLTWQQAGVANLASTAVANAVPGGAALAFGANYAILSSWGYRTSEIMLSFLVPGVWNAFLKLALPLLGLVLLLLAGEVTTADAVAAALGGVSVAVALVVVVAFLRRESAAAAIGRVAARTARPFLRLFGKQAQSWERQAIEFRRDAIGLVRSRWARLTLHSVLNHASFFVVLLLSLRFLGVDADLLSAVEVFAVFAAVRMLTALPITPGGAGIAELGLTAGLSELAAGTPEVDAAIVAAVLVFRATTFLLPVPLGAGAYLIWRRQRRRRPA